MLQVRRLAGNGAQRAEERRTARTASCALIALASVAAVSIVVRVANAEDARLEEIVVRGRAYSCRLRIGEPHQFGPSKTFNRGQAVTVHLVLNTLPSRPVDHEHGRRVGDASAPDRGR